MNRINDILFRKGNNAISVSPESSVLDALKVMAENNIGSVVVMSENKFHGIITERDYSRKVILKGKNSSDTKVSDIMTTDFPPLNGNDTVEHCMELLSKNNLRYLPVFNGETLAGIISISDVVRQMVIVQQEVIEHLDNYIRGN